MNRLYIALTALVLTAGSLWARDDEVIVTRQITTGQRHVLPEKTIEVEMKRLAFNKKADPALVKAITQVMDTIAREDYLNRTFVLLIEPKTDGTVAIGARNDDIVTRGIKDATIYHGSLEYQRYHFVVLTNKDNGQLLEGTFKRQGKVKFVQEFEMVDYPTPHYPTNVIGQWAPGRSLRWMTVVIDEDPDAGHEASRIKD